ncbi:MAG: SDR family oxidoreductase [Planctomycetales bacterium]|nr:SDR family oxidoreductase [Planctomycetales bacterium]
MSKLIFGCGYLGERVARRWQEACADVHVVTRSEKRAGELRSRGYSAIVANVAQPGTLQDLPAVDTVLFAVGYDRSSSVSIGEVYAGGVRNVLAALPASVARFIYISTTGVYGTAEGDWVDEATPTNPQREGGKASLAAEEVIAAHPLADSAIILRLAGIYGPGRIPYLDRLRAGQPIAAPDRGWLNLIHVDDAASVVLTAEAWTTGELVGGGPHVFCVCDGAPVIRGDFYREVARLLGTSAPVFEEPDPTSPAALRAAANKRICNQRIMQMLDTKLSYPTYREGLASILSQ